MHGPSLKHAGAFVREVLDDRRMLEAAATAWAKPTKGKRQRLPKTLSPTQLRALERCHAVPTAAYGWFSLEDAGLGRSTIRALQKLGALESRYPGFRGQMFGQLYRITPLGLAVLAGAEK